MMKMTFKSIINGRAARTGLAAAAAVAALLLFCRPAGANPRPLPFTYPYETLGKGQAEIEFYGDMTPLRVLADPTDASKGRLYEPAYVLQTEFEYGISDRLELGLYQVFEASPKDGGTNAMTFDGFKWRLRYRLAEPGELPVDIAFYAELETMHDELALEEKVILAKHFGNFHWMGNLWVEQELERPYDGGDKDVDFVINPTTGITYEISPVVRVGAEYWARGTLSPETINDRVHHFIGPTFHANFGTLWWTIGAYANLNNINNPELGEIYGPMWLRSVIGIEL